MKTIIAGVLLTVASLTACASVRGTASYIEAGVSATDAAILANDAAWWLTAVPLPPARTTLMLLPASRADGAAVVTERLRAAGYGIYEPSKAHPEPPTDGVPIRYLVSSLRDGTVLLRLQYEGTEATRIYTRAQDGTLVALAPFTVRSAQ
jgi:predicted small secreted protein